MARSPFLYIRQKTVSKPNRARPQDISTCTASIKRDFFLMTYFDIHGDDGWVWTLFTFFFMWVQHLCRQAHFFFFSKRPWSHVSCWKWQLSTYLHASSMIALQTLTIERHHYWFVLWVPCGIVVWCVTDVIRNGPVNYMTQIKQTTAISAATSLFSSFNDLTCVCMIINF